MPKKAKSQNLIFPILLGSIFLSLIFLAYYSRTIPQINRVHISTPAPTSSSTSACPNLKSTSISKTSLNPGEKFTYSCNFDKIDTSCIAPISTPYNFETNTFPVPGASATKSPNTFEATAPRIPGNYTITCQISNSQSCKDKGFKPCIDSTKTIQYTVLGSPIPKPTGLTFQCLNGGKKIKLSWNPIANGSGYTFKLHNLSAADGTDITASNYTTASLEKEITPNNKYSFTIQAQGANNAISEPIVGELSCIPSPTGLQPKTGDMIEPGSQVITWNKVSNATGYIVIVGSSTNTTTTNSFSFNFSPSQTYHIAVYAYIDNVNYSSLATESDIAVKGLPPTPANPRVTCAPDGKTALLAWDGVTDVESYKLRLDDKNGHVTNYDDLKVNKHTVNITPTKQYAWWVHSHKGNLDSYQTISLNFTCKNTITPRPTVKPTPTPTLTPTPSPTPTPTPKPTPIPTPYPTSTPTPLPVEQPGVFTRFFTWLGSLFSL